MIRTQIQLEPGQYQRLKALAARRSTSIAKLVREGVDHVLACERNESSLSIQEETDCSTFDVPRTREASGDSDLDARDGVLAQERLADAQWIDWADAKRELQRQD